MQYTSAVETLDRLREVIDAHLFADPLKQLQQRTWLLHWANFVYWSLPSDGPQKFLDLVLQDGFNVALQIKAPHLLRCESLCVITHVPFL
jgi:translation initiation factor 3 subunit E